MNTSFGRTLAGLADDASWTGPGSDFADLQTLGARQSRAPVRASEVDTIVVGISGVRQNAAAAVAVGGRLQAFCEQERLTRLRRSALTRGALPEEAVEAVLQLAGSSRARVQSYATAESEAILPAGLPEVRFDHHFGHAATAFLTSPFDRAAVVVCDEHSSPQLTVWRGRGGEIRNEPWAWSGEGFAAIYSQCAGLFGLGHGQEHRLEALARLHHAPDVHADIAACFSYADGQLRVAPDWKARIMGCLGSRGPAWPLSVGASVAASFQRELGRHLLAFLADVRATVGEASICLGGGLFYNTFFNTLVSQSGIFERTFVAPNPGNAGLAAGAALAARPSAAPAGETSPFLGPDYDLEQIKTTLDNCKLTCECLTEGQVIDTVVRALAGGQLVGWFQGRMEWGHRALGNRSILASPLSPFVLENLNSYLKKRNRHRAYGLSVTEEDAGRYFAGPPQSRWMEYDYDVQEPQALAHVLPGGARSLRVQTVPSSANRFHRLHKAFAATTGLPVLINTSFNGFSEPIVCSPRDAVRVFYGTGLDLLVLDRFVLRK